MIEANKFYEGAAHDVGHAIKSEQYPAFKREYSKPRTRWSVAEMKERFPHDKREGNILISDDHNMRRIFRFFQKRDAGGNVIEEYAHEVNRIEFDPQKAKDDPFAALWRDESRYDEDGYLIYYAVVVANTNKNFALRHRVSYQQTYRYGERPDGTKELLCVIEQDVAKGPDLTPGMPIGKPYPTDFSNVPLE